MLEKVFKLFTYLQKSSIDLVTASQLVQLFENDINTMRSEYELEFEQIENEASQLAQMCDVTTEYKQHRVRKSKRFQDEIAEDDGIVDARKKFIFETYLLSLDCAINSTTRRFENFKNVASKFSCLDPKHFTDADNVSKLESLADMYSNGIASSTIVQEFL